MMCSFLYFFSFLYFTLIHPIYIFLSLFVKYSLCSSVILTYCIVLSFLSFPTFLSCPFSFFPSFVTFLSLSFFLPSIFLHTTFCTLSYVQLVSYVINFFYFSSSLFPAILPSALFLFLSLHCVSIYLCVASVVNWAGKRLALNNLDFIAVRYTPKTTPPLVDIEVVDL